MFDLDACRSRFGSRLARARLLLGLLVCCLVGTQAFGLLHAVTHGLPGAAASSSFAARAFAGSPVQTPALTSAAAVADAAQPSAVHAFANAGHHCVLYDALMLATCAGPAFVSTPLFARVVARALQFYSPPSLPGTPRAAFRSRAPPLSLR